MSTILTSTFAFEDLQLDVKGCQDVYASFDKYVEVERLEGDNKYQAEQYGLQVSCFHHKSDMKILREHLARLKFCFRFGQNHLKA